jgi:predicted nucleotidyltransferase
MKKFGLSADIINDITATIKRFPKVEKVLIYGSRATNSYKEYSDIDLAIFSHTITTQEFSDLWNQLNDLPITFKVDVVHFEELHNEDLKQEILATGKIFCKH